MAKCRIGHFAEAQILQSLNVDFIDESEVLTPADEQFHINKHEFTVPFVCGCKNLGEALRRIHEGAAMMRTKGEAGTGNIVEAIRHIRAVNSSIASLANRRNVEYERMAQEMRVPYQLVLTTAKLGRLPVVNFAAGGIATPADASMCMQLGCDGVFVGSGIFKSSEPEKRAEAIVNAVANFADARALAKASEGIGEAMRGLDVKEIPHQNRFSFRGV